MHIYIFFLACGLFLLAALIRRFFGKLERKISNKEIDGLVLRFNKEPEKTIQTIKDGWIRKRRWSTFFGELIFGAQAVQDILVYFLPTILILSFSPSKLSKESLIFFIMTTEFLWFLFCTNNYNDQIEGGLKEKEKHLGLVFKKTIINLQNTSPEKERQIRRLAKAFLSERRTTRRTVRGYRQAAEQIEKIQKCLFSKEGIRVALRKIMF